MNIAEYVDYAILKPTHTEDDLKRECEIAKKLEVASVCVKPYHVKVAKKILIGSVVEVGTVIGFPHGSSTIQTKLFETSEAIENGATEIDAVINIGKVLEKDYYHIENEIRELVDLTHSKNVLLKVIIEACYLSDEHIINLCQICNNLEVDYVKTSTGFGSNGATIEQVELIKKHISNGVKIKASGGIKTLEQAEQFINAGCQRIGLSSMPTT